MVQLARHEYMCKNSNRKLLNLGKISPTRLVTPLDMKASLGGIIWIPQSMDEAAEHGDVALNCYVESPFPSSTS